MYSNTCVHEKSNTPFSYMHAICLLCKKAYRELNLKRALNVDTGPGDTGTVYWIK